MIWFACSKCGKKHGRPETSIGSLIFCDCGQGVTVPWESTIEAPEVEPEPVETLPPPLPPPPRLESIPISEEQVPVVRRPRERERRRERRPARDPHRCLNHQDLLTETTCAGCEERFCRHCVVTFQGKTLCGPCKNKAIRDLVQPPRTSYWAVFSPFVALLGYMGFFFFLIPGLGYGNILAVAGFITLAQLLALGLGLVSVHKMQRDPHLIGQSLAVTGMAAAGIGILLAGVASMYSALPGV